MDTNELKMTDLWPCCQNDQPINLLPKEAEIPEIDNLGSDGYVVVMDFSSHDHQNKMRKLRSCGRELHEYGFFHSLILLQFRRNGTDEHFFVPAIVGYSKRTDKKKLNTFELLYYTCKSLKFALESEGFDDEINDFDYAGLTRDKDGKSTFEWIDTPEVVELIPNLKFNQTLANCGQFISVKCMAQYEGVALVPTGVPSGFKDLDILTSGWQKSDLIVIAGKPTTGKSAFALSMIRNIAYESDCKIPCAMFSLEMSKERLAARFMMIAGSKIPMDNEIEFPLYIDDTPRLSVSELDKRLTQLVSEKGVKIAFIDYIQLMDSPELVKTPSRREEFRKTMEHLKELAVRLDIPIIALMMQYSIDKDQNGKINESKPQLSYLHFADIIDRYADTVAFIQYADDNENIDEKDVQFVIAKQSNGKTGTVTLKFDTKKACFIKQSKQ